jgi:D-arabinose 1-dehydrogenase-like Zn-dependent alcohol dehydrogenase
MTQREVEVKAAANDSHIDDLYQIFSELINQHMVLQTINVNDNFESAIQLINKNGYYGVIGITFQNSWYVLFGQLSKNQDLNNDIFGQLRGLITITRDQENYGHAMVVKRIKYNRDTEEYEYLIKNSWGPSWGNNGEIWIPESCLPLFYTIDVICFDKEEVE